MSGRIRASRALTSGWLTLGTLVSALCFVIALAAEQAGQAGLSGEMTDMAAILDGLRELSPWAWASLGTYAVIITPVVGIVITAREYAAIGDRRTVRLALAVLAVLAISVVVAVIR